MTVHILRGLPGSGKTTLALQMLKDNPRAIRVCRDDLRTMLHGGVFSPENEMIVKAVRNQLIRWAVLEGMDVIVDETNMSRRSFVDLCNVVDRITSARTQVHFVDTPIEECIRRDRLRKQSVGEEVIRRMWDEYNDAH